MKGASAQMMSFSRCLIKVSCRIHRGCVLRPLYICNEIKLFMDAARRERERERLKSHFIIFVYIKRGGGREFIQLQAYNETSLPNKRERISLSGICSSLTFQYIQRTAHVLSIKIAQQKLATPEFPHLTQPTESAQTRSIPFSDEFLISFSSFSSHFSLKLISIYLFAPALAQHFALTHFRSLAEFGYMPPFCISVLLLPFLSSDMLWVCHRHNL